MIYLCHGLFPKLAEHFLLTRSSPSFACNTPEITDTSRPQASGNTSAICYKTGLLVKLYLKAIVREIVEVRSWEKVEGVSRGHCNFSIVNISE